MVDGSRLVAAVAAEPPTVQPVAPAPAPAPSPAVALPLPGKAQREPAEVPASSRSSRRVSGALSRIRNPWVKPLEDGAPDTREFERRATAAAAAERRAARDDGSGRPARRFSDTLWFMNGVQPDDVKKLEDDGAVEIDDGHYEKKKDLPSEVRRRFTLDTQELEPVH